MTERHKPSYEELVQRLADAEAQLSNVYSGEGDTLSGPDQTLETRLIKAEDDLRQSFLFNRAILDNLSAHICVIDVTGRIVEVNEAWRGFALPNALHLPNFSVGSNYLEICEQATGDCSEGAAEAAAQIRAVLHAEQPFGYLEYPCHSPDEQRWFAMRVSRLDVPAGPYSVIAHENITIRKLSELARARSEESLRTTLLSVADAVLATDLEGRIVRMNPAAERLTGWTEEAAQGKGSSEVLQLFDEASMVPIEDPLRQVLATSVGYRLPPNAVLRRPDGELLPVADSMAPIFDDSGQISGAVAILQDDSERRLEQRKLEVRLSLYEYARTHTMSELLTESLDQIGALSQSPIGFYHFLEPDGRTISLQEWSTHTRATYCHAEGHGQHYHLDKAGVWADAIRLRRPVVHNDYDALPNKQGLPEGRARLTRELVVPVMRDGNVVAILGLGNKPTDYSAQDVETAAFIADVTWELVERKRGEEALASSEKAQRNLIANLNCGIVVHGPDTAIQSINTEAARILGIEAQDAIGLTIDALCWRFFDEDGVPMAKEDFPVNRVVSSGLPLHYVVISLENQKSGGLHWVSVSAYPEHSDESAISSVVVTFFDITALKTAEKSLREANTTFLATFEQAAVGVAHVAPDGRWIRVNQRLCDIVGYTSAELIQCTFQDITHPDDLDLDLANLRKLIDGQQDHYAIEKRYLRKDGTCIWIELTVALVREDNGAPAYFISVIEDIQQRKTADLQLRAMSEQLQISMETAQLGRWQLDLDSGLLEGDERWLAIYGLQAEQFEGTFDHWCKLLHPDDRDLAIRMIDSMRAGVATRQVTFRAVGPDGSTIHVLSSGAAVRDERGEIIALQGVDADVTHIKRTEESWLRSNQLLRMISLCNEVLVRSNSESELLGEVARHVVDEGRFALCWITRLDDRECLVWEAIAHDVGIDRDAVERLTERIYALVQEKLGGIEGPINTDALSGLKELMEFRTLVSGIPGLEALNPACCKQISVGAEPWGFICVFHTRIESIPQNEADLIAELAEDLTYGLTALQERRIRAEAEQTSALLRSALEASADAVVISDKEGAIIWVNPAFELLCGYTSDELLGQNPRLLKSGLQDRGYYEKLWNAILKGMPWRGELTNRRKDGRLYVVQSTITPVRDSNGQISYFIGIQEDATERHRQEAQYRQAQKQEALGTLAGGIVHDFNNVLAAIMGYGELLRDELSANSTQREDMDRILVAAGRARDLVAQILTFSRMRELERAPLRLEYIVKEALKLLRATIPATIELREHIYKSNRSVNADATQMHQLVMNLCTNAFQAIGETKGTITVTLEERTLSALDTVPLIGIEPGEYSYLEVRDSGPGIPPEIAERIFEPFFTTKGVGEGTGMGLATVQGIVQQHGGHISVDCQDGVGACFHIWLPCVEDPQSEAPADAPSPSEGRGHILILDDEADVCSMLKRRLEKIGYDTFSMASSAEALDYLQKHKERFSLIITDQQMPDVAGKDIAAAMRRISPDTPIIGMSGYSRAVNEENFAELGFTAFFPKPIDFNRLATTIRELLAAKESR